MRAWLLLLAVLATFKPFVQVAGTEDITTLISATISTRSVTSLYNPLIGGTDVGTSRLAEPTVLLYDSSSDKLNVYENDESESENNNTNKKSDINETNINTNNDDSDENLIIEIKSIEQRRKGETTNEVKKSQSKKKSKTKQSESLSRLHPHKPKKSQNFVINRNEDIDIEKVMKLKSDTIETEPMQERSSTERIVSRQNVFGESAKTDLSDVDLDEMLSAEIDSYDTPSSSSLSSEIPERILSNIPPPDFDFQNFDTAAPESIEDQYHNGMTYDVTINEEEIELENHLITEVTSISPSQSSSSSSSAPPTTTPSTPASTQSSTSKVTTKKKSKRKSKKHHHNPSIDRDVHDNVINSDNSATPNIDNGGHFESADNDDVLSQETYSDREKIGEKLKPDPSTLVQIENSLLSLFNMKRPPKIDRSKIIIPEAMKQLYAEIMGHDIDSVNIPKRGLLAKSANTVRSFTHLDSKIDQRFPHHHRFRLHFDIRTIPTEEKLKAAELQLSRDDISHALLKPHLANRTRYQVLAYDILRVGIKGKREPTFLLLDNKTIRLNSTDTISLDVQPAVERWLETPKRNYGLLIEVRTFRGLKPAPHHHVRLRRSADEPHENWQRKQPLLFTYTDDGRQKSRSIRDVSTRSKRAGHHRRPHRRKNNVEICRRQSLYVDFTDVGWSDWIVAPPGYDAYYCHGKCPFPLAEHLNSTNHAVVQTLVNNLNPGKVPNACCVPTQLTGISMLYLNDQSTVVLKNYQDMTVVGCGCR